MRLKVFTLTIGVLMALRVLSFAGPSNGPHAQPEALIPCENGLTLGDLARARTYGRSETFVQKAMARIINGVLEQSENRERHLEITLIRFNSEDPMNESLTGDALVLLEFCRHNGLNCRLSRRVTHFDEIENRADPRDVQLVPSGVSLQIWTADEGWKMERWVAEPIKKDQWTYRDRKRVVQSMSVEVSW